MSSFTGKEALFIDIDDTITRIRDGATPEKVLHGQSLLGLMCEMACKNGMDRTQAEEIIGGIIKDMPWWHWTDFICALGLDAAEFWEYAFQEEQRHLEPICKDLGDILKSLKEAGYRLYITSNNPNSGILLKLRIAGLAQIWGSPYFIQYLNPPDMRASKSNVEFWKRSLAHTGLRGDEIVTIGDSWRDDIQNARAGGITRTIYLDHRNENGQGDAPLEPGIWRAQSWQEVKKLLLNGN